MKKTLEIVSELCDARHITEAKYEEYEKVIIHTEILIVNEKSHRLLRELNAEINAEKIISTEKEVDIITINASHKITANALPKPGSILTVNGGLEIEPGAREAVSRYAAIIVNGNLECPESMMSELADIDVNGMIGTYPDGYVKLKNNFVIDKYFPVRASDNGRYYAGSAVKLIDKSVDTAKLIEKNVRFKTKRFIVPEEMLNECLPMFDETVELFVAPEGFSIADGSKKLNEELVNEYGGKIFIYGDLDARGDITDVLRRIERLEVTGKVKVDKENEEAFRAIGAKYRRLDVVITERKEGNGALNAASLRITAVMLENSKNVVEIGNAASIEIDEDVTAESIEKKLKVENAAKVVCSDEQYAAVCKVCGNAAKISVRDKNRVEITCERYDM